MGKKITLIKRPKFFIRQTFTDKPLRPDRKINANYFIAPYDGDVSRIALGEGAGFSKFSIERLSQYNEQEYVVPPNFAAVKKFYQVLKTGNFKF